jgi:hypothetical protein
LFSLHKITNPTYIFTTSKSFNKIDQLAGRRRETPWTTLGGLLPPSLDILGASTLLRLLAGLLLHLLSGLLLLLLGFLLLPFSIDISSKCLIILPSVLQFFLGYNYFLSFESKK